MNSSTSALTLTWQCSCGERLLDSSSAFLHRDGSAAHHVHICTSIRALTDGQQSGILRMEQDAVWMEEEKRHYASTEGSEYQRPTATAEVQVPQHGQFEHGQRGQVVEFPSPGPGTAYRAHGRNQL